MSAFISDEAAAQTAFIQQACGVSAIALLFCEICQTADVEIAHIWTRGRARMTLLFVTIRHVQFASLVLNAMSLSLTSISSEVCTTLTFVSSITDIIPYVGWAVFLGWRAYALSTRNALVGLLVFACSVSFVSPSLLNVIGVESVYIETPPTCTTAWRWSQGRFVSAYLVDISRTLNLLAELAVLALTYRATYNAWRSSTKVSRQPSLADVLYENGLVCFSAVTILQVVSFVFTVKSLSTANQFYGSITLFRDVIITIFLSRFLLELAKIGARLNGENNGVPETRGLLTTERDLVSDVPSQWTLDDEYNGRGFDRSIKERHEV